MVAVKYTQLQETVFLLVTIAVHTVYLMDHMLLFAVGVRMAM